MEDLRSEMATATKTALSLRKDLERVGERLTATLDLETPCARCGRELHRQPPAAAGPSGGALPRLFVFPTGNAFHGSCLCAEVAELAPAVQRQRVLSLAKRLASVAAGAATVPAAHGEHTASVDELRALLDNEVAVEDPYCGEMVVRHIRAPLIQAQETESSWAL